MKKLNFLGLKLGFSKTVTGDKASQMGGTSNTDAEVEGGLK